MIIQVPSLYRPACQSCSTPPEPCCRPTGRRGSCTQCRGQCWLQKWVNLFSFNINSVDPYLASAWWSRTSPCTRSSPWGWTAGCRCHRPRSPSRRHSPVWSPDEIANVSSVRSYLQSKLRLWLTSVCLTGCPPLLNWYPTPGLSEGLASVQMTLMHDRAEKLTGPS